MKLMSLFGKNDSLLGEFVCDDCGKVTSAMVKEEDLKQFKQGLNAHICFPYLPTEQINILTTGKCTECSNTN